MVNAHALGAQKTRELDLGLHEYLMSRKAMLWLRGGATSKLWARVIPLHPRSFTSQCQVFQRRSGRATEWILGT